MVAVRREPSDQDADNGIDTAGEGCRDGFTGDGPRLARHPYDIASATPLAAFRRKHRCASHPTAHCSPPACCSPPAAPTGLARAGSASARVAHDLTRSGQGWFEARTGRQVEWFVYHAGPSAMEALIIGSIDLAY